MNSPIESTLNEGQLGWWLVSGNDLLRMMRRVAAGEEPDLVFAECYANATDATALLEEDAA